MSFLFEIREESSLMKYESSKLWLRNYMLHSTLSLANLPPGYKLSNSLNISKETKIRKEKIVHVSYAKRTLELSHI